MVVPVTVAPEAGLVKAAVSTGVGGVTMPFFTLTFTVEPPVLFDASLTVAMSGWLPSTTIFVSYGIETGPLLAVVVEPMALPPSVSVYVFDAAVLPSSHITAQTVLLTVAPPVGCVTKTLSVPVGGGGGVATFETVTVCVAVPVPPMGSATFAVSVCGPLTTLVVSQEKLAPVPVTAVPSTFRPYVYVVPKPRPLPPVAASVTVVAPVTVALAVGAVNVTVGFVAGGGVVLLTLTASVALPLLPAESVTVAVSVCAPLAMVFVSQEYVGPVPGTVVPSTLRV